MQIYIKLYIIHSTSKYMKNKAYHHHHHHHNTHCRNTYSAMNAAKSLKHMSAHCFPDELESPIAMRLIWRWQQMPGTSPHAVARQQVFQRSDSPKHKCAFPVLHVNAMPATFYACAKCQAMISWVHGSIIRVTAFESGVQQVHLPLLVRIDLVFAPPLALLLRLYVVAFIWEWLPCLRCRCK